MADIFSLFLILVVLCGLIAFAVASRRAYRQAVRDDEALEAKWLIQKAENDAKGWPTVPRNRVFWGDHPVRPR